jgi:hypothetical protein
MKPAQAIDSPLDVAANNFKLEDNGALSPLIIFYQWALQKRLIGVQRLRHIVDWFWGFSQVRLTFFASVK